MIMHLNLRTVMAAVCTTLAIASGPVRGDEIPLITGQHWIESSEQAKKAYLIGIANVIQVDIAYRAQVGNSPPDTQSVIPRLAKGLQGQTLETVREGLDRWYATHSDRLQRPVIETIWFEMVVPGLQRNK